MEAKDIAAYGGLALGLINLGITVYKDFAKKGKLEVLETNFVLRKVDKMSYDFQLDIRLRAKNENIYIKEVFLRNEQCFTGYVNEDKKRTQLNIPLQYKRVDIAKQSPEQFQKTFIEISTSIDESMTDYKIEKESNKSITYVDRLPNPRETDGWEEFPKDGWSIEILYDKKVLITPLVASII